MPEVFLGLGSNIEPAKNLRVGVRELKKHFGAIDLSPVYKNAPVGFTGKDFLNAVARVRTERTPEQVLEVLRTIHKAIGRRQDKRKFAPRRLDIDLLLYDRLIIDEGHLRVPRRDVLHYSFVLRPLAELAPDLVHPVTGRTLSEHWRAFDEGHHPLTQVNVSLAAERD
ncbi:MAG: 2-amino-4-hydroxy-6-hydroxymethyldihydropteridine diphosphokinase [Woeseia sp.]